MTPPHQLLITRMPHLAVTLLVEHLLAEGASVQVCSVLENAPDSLLKIGSAEQDHHRV
jgi:hypothetical protein